MKKLLSFPIILIALTSQMSCTNIAVSSAQAVYNRHSIQKSMNDQYTTLRIYQTLKFNTDEFNDTNIVITTYNGEILLTGQAPQTWQKEKAESIARTIAPDAKIYNFITIGSPTSSLTKLSDSWITTKVKSKIIASDDVDATQIKVVTENGSVYLMGTLPKQAAEAAVDIARETDGVKQVIKMFSYIIISKDATQLT